MKFIFVLIFIAGFCEQGLAGTWSRAGNTTIRFEGRIEKGDVERLEQILQPKDDTIVVRSTGGDTEVGLKLANKLLPLKMNLLVDGYCASSCANYLFTAAHSKEIRLGWVGFHGNISALLTKDWDRNAKDLKEKYGLTDKQIQEFYDHQVDVSRLEKEYLLKTGVSQELFDRTQSDDKGIGDGNSYSFLCPLPETFKKYGIRNVSGQQEINYGNFPGLNNVLH